MAATRMIRLLGRPCANGAEVRGNKPWAITAYLALADGPVSRDRLISLLFEDANGIRTRMPDRHPCWETWAARGLGLHAAAVGDQTSALSHLADAITRSRAQRGGHLWSHVWVLTDAVELARRTGDP